MIVGAQSAAVSTIHQELSDLLPDAIGRTACRLQDATCRPFWWPFPGISAGNWLWMEVLEFTRVEPEKMAQPADIDHRRVLFLTESYLEHRIGAAGTRRPGDSFAPDRPLPKGIDQLGGKSSSQQIESEGATAASFATPENSVRHFVLPQRLLTPRAGERRRHCC